MADPPPGRRRPGPSAVGSHLVRVPGGPGQGHRGLRLLLRRHGFLRRLYVLVFIEHGTRRVHLGGITTNPNGPWVSQRARELVERFAGFKFLIRDRDSKFTRSFDDVFAFEGIDAIRTPVQAPNANAICERVVGTVRRECLDHLLVFGGRHLEHVLTEYLAHYNRHRPHRSLGQRPPDAPDTAERSSPTAVIRHDVLGGLVHEYRRAA